jgi:hypothetical protein
MAEGSKYSLKEGGTRGRLQTGSGAGMADSSSLQGRCMKGSSERTSSKGAGHLLLRMAQC